MNQKYREHILFTCCMSNITKSTIEEQIMDKVIYTKEDLNPKLNLIADGILDNGIIKNGDSPYVNKGKLGFVKGMFIRKYDILGSTVYTMTDKVKHGLKKKVKRFKSRHSNVFIKSKCLHIKLEAGVDLFIDPSIDETPT